MIEGIFQHYENTEDRAEIIENLMEHFGDSVVRWAYMLLKDKGMAEDAAQDVFIICYKKWDTYRGEASIKTWLYRITANRCKDIMGSWAYRTVKLRRFISEKESITHSSPEAVLMKNEEDTELMKCILKLPMKYKEPILLYYYEELKTTEIAAILDIKENTVKSLLMRGRKLLKSQFERSLADGK